MLPGRSAAQAALVCLYAKPLPSSAADPAGAEGSLGGRVPATLSVRHSLVLGTLACVQERNQPGDGEPCTWTQTHSKRCVHPTRATWYALWLSRHLQGFGAKTGRGRAASGCVRAQPAHGAGSPAPGTASVTTSQTGESSNPVITGRKQRPGATFGQVTKKSLASSSQERTELAGRQLDRRPAARGAGRTAEPSAGKQAMREGQRVCGQPGRTWMFLVLIKTLRKR